MANTTVIIYHATLESIINTTFGTVFVDEDSDSDLTKFIDDFHYETETTIATLDCGALVVLLFIICGIFLHSKSESLALIMITSCLYLSFFIVCAILLILSLISILFVNQSNRLHWIFSVAILFLITSINTYFINLIGCKDYRAFICYNKCIICKLNVKYVLIIGGILVTLLSLISTALCGMGLYQISQDNNNKYLYIFLLFELLSMLLMTSISSFYSKISQLQWINVVVFISMYLISFIYNKIKTNEDDESRPLFNPYLLYWHALITCVVSVISLFGFAPYKKLRLIFLGILGSFFSIFDIVTDVNIILIWITYKAYWWAILQIFFILSGQIFSAWFVKDYYDTKQANQSSKKSNLWGQLFTLIGLGRIWHNILGWDSDKHRDKLISSKILKIWEMIFESFPTIILQMYITLQIREQYEWSLIISVAVSFLSVTFTVFRILFFDHHSLSRTYNLDHLKTLEDIKKEKYEKHRMNKYKEDSYNELNKNSPISPMNDDDNVSNYDDIKNNETANETANGSENIQKDNMMKLVQKGYGMSDLTKAFGTLQQEKELKHIDEHHPLFVEIMVQILDNKSIDDIKIFNNNKGNHIELQTLNKMATPHAMSKNVSVQSASHSVLDDQSPSSIHLSVDSLNKINATDIDKGDDMKKEIGLNRRNKSRLLSIMSDHDIKKLELDHPAIQELRNAGYDCSSLERAWTFIKTNEEYNNLTMDDDRFEAVMLNVLETKLEIQPNIDLMDRNTIKVFRNWSSKFICCFCLDLFCGSCIDNKKDGNNNDQHKELSVFQKMNIKRQRGSKACDFLFYCIIYVYIITDFYARIFPILSYLVIRMLIAESSFDPNEANNQNISYWDSYTVYNEVRGEFIFILLGLTLYEYCLYRYMLKRPYNNWQNAIRFFWTGWFTVSFFLLSTLHLSYLPTNVMTKRLFKEHIGRMIIQFIFALSAIYNQIWIYKQSFFIWTFVVFGITWILNIISAIHIRQYSLTFVSHVEHINNK